MQQTFPLTWCSLLHYDLRHAWKSRWYCRTELFIVSSLWQYSHARMQGVIEYTRFAIITTRHYVFLSLGQCQSERVNCMVWWVNIHFEWCLLQGCNKNDSTGHVAHCIMTSHRTEEPANHWMNMLLYHCHRTHSVGVFARVATSCHCCIACHNCG